MELEQVVYRALPEWATWTSHELWGLQDSSSGGTIGGVAVGATTVKLGWVTYLSSLPAVSGLPEGVKHEPCGDGALMTIGCSPTRMTERLLCPRATRSGRGEQIAARVQALERRPPPRRADTCWLLAAAALYGDTLAGEFRGV